MNKKNDLNFNPLARLLTNDKRILSRIRAGEIIAKSPYEELLCEAGSPQGQGWRKLCHGLSRHLQKGRGK